MPMHRKKIGTSMPCTLAWRTLLVAIAVAAVMQNTPAAAQAKKAAGKKAAAAGLPALGTAVAFPNLRFDRPGCDGLSRRRVEPSVRRRAAHSHDLVVSKRAINK